MIDLIGKQFGRLTVIASLGSRLVEPTHFRRFWLCRCECGKNAEPDTTNLKNGKIKSCGCLRRDLAANLNVIHGMSTTCEFKIWAKLGQRCENPRCKDYVNYGGRGIHLCERWHEFAAFLNDMGPRPSPLHSIDRIDNDGNYEPGNCRWATRKEQCNNKRHNRRYILNGESLTLSQWSDRTSISLQALCWRYEAGWTAEEALTIPVGRGRRAHIS